MYNIETVGFFCRNEEKSAVSANKIAAVPDVWIENVVCTSDHFCFEFAAFFIAL